MYLSIVFMSISAMAKKIPNHINLLKESADLQKPPGQPKCPLGKGNWSMQWLSLDYRLRNVNPFRMGPIKPIFSPFMHPPRSEGCSNEASHPRKANKIAAPLSPHPPPQSSTNIRTNVVVVYHFFLSFATVPCFVQQQQLEVQNASLPGSGNSGNRKELSVDK